MRAILATRIGDCSPSWLAALRFTSVEQFPRPGLPLTLANFAVVR